MPYLYELVVLMHYAFKFKWVLLLFINEFLEQVAKPYIFIVTVTIIEPFLLRDDYKSISLLSAPSIQSLWGLILSRKRIWL